MYRYKVYIEIFVIVNHGAGREAGYHSKPTYTIYLYVFITVKTEPQLNHLSRTAQTVITIQSQNLMGKKGMDLIHFENN